ncbi:DUF4349 domain-containing protein [Microbacterium sp. NPDC055357]
MNTSPIDAALPELSEARIDDIENAVFADIARERSAEQARRARRGRWGIAGGAAAAVVAIAALISPAVGGMITVTGQSGADSAVPLVAPASDGGAWAESESSVSREELAGVELTPEMDAGGHLDDARDVITTASASIVVSDVAEAARSVSDAAVDRGGYVESMNVGTTGRAMTVDPATGFVHEPYPPVPVDGAWVTVRVPAGELTALVDELAEFGDVTASSVQRQDVTEQSVDLSARIDAARASVTRLTELMAQAGDLSDLIAAESALAERQSELESLEQQLELLTDQVALSTLTVSLSPVTPVVEADPAGFGDGLAAGWNGLVATLNGIVIALGFLLPWLAVVGVAGAVAWVVVRSVRRRKAARTG